jgi:predicted exporter/lauroyl/myristoyl acyltransferase
MSSRLPADSGHAGPPPPGRTALRIGRRSVFWLSMLCLLSAIGFHRLRLDPEVLNLLPQDLPSVQGLKLYEEHFTDASQLILTLACPDPEQASQAAQEIARFIESRPDLAAAPRWQPPWLENPGELAELAAYLWFNQAPDTFQNLAHRLAPDRLAAQLEETRELLRLSLSPTDVARASRDPYGLMRLPESSAAPPAFTPGQDPFSNAEGTFRIILVTARTPLTHYRACQKWLKGIQQAVAEFMASKPEWGAVRIGFTGRPAFVAEIGGSMESDMRWAAGSTALLIALIFYVAHRRLKPLVWLLCLLGVVLAGTLALGGLIYGSIHLVSLGFAAILLGLGVDYAVVLYHEALAHPSLTPRQVRRAMAPGIVWAALTTIAAFLVLNTGGLPGLAQLGTLVALGVALAAGVMMFAYLPPLLSRREPAGPGEAPPQAAGGRTLPWRLGLWLTLFLALLAGGVGFVAPPKLDARADPLRPRHSPAYEAMAQMRHWLGQDASTLWFLARGRTESEVAAELVKAAAMLVQAQSNGLINSFWLPADCWPRPDHQAANRAAALALVNRREALRTAAAAAGFTPLAVQFTDQVLDTWQAAVESPAAFWPTNPTSRWVLDRFAVRTDDGFFALGQVQPVGNPASLVPLQHTLNGPQRWLTNWEWLGGEAFDRVKSRLGRVTWPMVVLVLGSLGLAFRRPGEVILSVCALGLSGLCLLAAMGLLGWSWNLLNLMAIPLLLGTGVDYGIFMQLALRRHRGDVPAVWRSVGRALLLCGTTGMAGFGCLGMSYNPGIASLGRVCALGIACNMAVAILLLPAWWLCLEKRRARCAGADTGLPSPLRAAASQPSSLYRADLWRGGLWLARTLPRTFSVALGLTGARLYWALARHRRQIVIENLLPVAGNSRAAAEAAGRRLFEQFALKLLDLWRYEGGLPIEDLFGPSEGWEHFLTAQAQYRGVLLLTPHLGNWELGAPWLARRGVSLLVITLSEPDEDFTRMRQVSRARWNIETLVIRNDPFAFLEIIRRLEQGATVALLVDRPPAPTAVTVELFGRPFAASVAPAELARAAGCALLPVFLPRSGNTYEAHILPPIRYERGRLRDREERRRLTQAIMTAFEPVIRKHPDQWYHFVPVWPAAASSDQQSDSS